MKHVLTQLCQQVRDARESSTPLYIHGGNTKSFYGEPILGSSTGDGADESQSTASAIPDRELQPLDVSPYRGIISYQPSELVVTARAGTLLSEIEQTVAEQGQSLAFEPPRFGPASTLGGCIASGLSGPRRMAVGGADDFVLGARLLHSSGEVLSFGGEVMKNVAGYDVSRLLVGSLGTLGPIVELSIKVLPVPPMEQTQRLDVDQDEALQHLDAWRRLPLPISATTWLSDSANGKGSLYVRISGSRPAVVSTVAHIGGEAVQDAAASSFWNALRDQTHPFFQQRPLWRVAVPPTTPSLDLGPTLLEWNGGLRWVVTDMSAQLLRQKVESVGGHATFYRYDSKSADAPVFHPLPKALERINRRMIEQFDPVGIFNPGRRFPAIKG